MTDPFSPGEFFHIYTRTNGAELLFRTKENYTYFLQKYQDHCLPIFQPWPTVYYLIIFTF